VVGNDFHGLFLPHEEAEALVLAVTEDAGVSNAAFFPGFVAGSFVEEGFAEGEEFGAEGAHYFLLMTLRWSYVGSRKESASLDVIF